MSAEADFRALLVAHAPLVALVGGAGGVAQNAVEQGRAPPYVVFSAQHAPEYGLDNTLLADEVTFSVECWAADAGSADAVADEVATALAIGARLVPTARATGYDAETGLDATVLTIQWWA